MKRYLLFALLSTSCTILFRPLLPDECETEGPIRCEGEVLLVCVDGLIGRDDCAPGQCIAADGTFLCEDAECGNGTIESSEDCEGADLNNQNCQSLGFAGGALACDAACAFDTNGCIDAICGDTLITGDEECDDENQLNGDGCNAQCQLEVCGDGIDNNNDDEECDGADLSGEDCLGLGFDGGDLACNASCFFDLSGCTVIACGNGVIDGADECDDGNNSDDDGCDGSCFVEVCGDGVINFDLDLNALDDCDDGNNINGDGCTGQCEVELCGDGIDNNGPSEECDDGNVINGDGCDNDCTVSVCGNGIAAGGESCDDGNVTNGDGCDNNCTITGCPNGVVTAGEECDDGNSIDNDGCTNTCQQSNCGNGIPEAAFGEQCDDGNNVNGDGCDNNCTSTACGNNIITVGEACDDGNNTNGDGCTSACVLEVCGDGVDNNGSLEQCDDGNAINGDGCDSNCTFPVCGNGIAAGAEQCDDGNTANGDGCTAGCLIEGCGDGHVQAALGEQCDDGVGGALQILALTPNGCQALDHDAITGDDRGGIAVSRDRVFYTGDNSTGAFDLTFLTGTNTGLQLDALTSDLSSGKVYSLGDGGAPIEVGGGTVTTLIEVNPSTGELLGNVLTLSEPIDVFDNSGIFAGPGRVVLHDGNSVFEISTINGQVTNHGAIGFIPHNFCENWAYWGIAEFFGGELFLTVIDGDDIVRHRVSDGLTTTVASFNNLGDMCSFTVSPTLNRWYFHHEGTSQFNSSEETIGYCNATFSLAGGAPLPGDGCSAQCEIEVCGDGIDNNGVLEECDDGNAIDGDGCESDCTFTCGSGVAVIQRVLDEDSGHCYLGFEEEVDWFTARDSCADIGGHLVTIQNFRENTLVFQMDPGAPRWMGLNDLEPPDGLGEAESEPLAFAYENDELVNFHYFFPGEPNDFDDVEDCAHLFGDFEPDATDTWNDVFCDLELPYVCEIDAPDCGNGAIEVGEECDDGNLVDNDGCNNACTRACGDGVVQGAITPNVRSITFIYLATDCTNIATRTFSINGVDVDAPPSQAEFCDCSPGIENFTVTDPAILAALLPSNNVLSVSIDEADSFLSWAVAVFETSAGNGFIPQVIFDQNGGGDALALNPDLCDAGDVEGPVSRNTFPFTLSFTETCDDGNINNLDACRSDCQPNICGDGVTNLLAEECDDGDDFDFNLCRNDCTFNVCGDGLIDFEEEDCDGSDFGGADCTSFGFEVGALSCDATCSVVLTGCAFAVCGDGAEEGFDEACDDGNTIAGDGCTNCIPDPIVLEIEPNDDETPEVGTDDFGAIAVQNADNNGAFTQDAMIQGAISIPGDDDFYAVTNNTAAFVELRFETFTDAAATACGVDTILVVRNANGDFLDFDDDSGIPFCDRIDDFFLPPGETIYVQVVDFDDDEALGQYFLLIDFD